MLRVILVSLALVILVSLAFRTQHSAKVPNSSVTIGKPNVPIQLTTKSSGLAEIGSLVTIDVQAKPQVDAPLFSIDVRLPQGVKDVGDGLQWEGPLSKNQERAFTAKVTLTERKRAVVTVLTGIHFNDGSRVYKAAEVTLEPSGTFKASPPGNVVSRSGARVIEHQGVER